MKVAILHDYLNQFGGAERVLQAIIELFPDADLYTLLYDERKTLGFFKKNLKKTSLLDNKLVRGRHRMFIPLMPIVTNLLRSKEKYDLIVSSTAGYGKGINIKAPFHISYCHSPLRYAWEIDYLKELPFAPWQLSQFFVHPIAGALRRWDKKASERVNIFIANSAFIANKISAYYGREAQVIYPPVDTSIFYTEPRSVDDSDGYYLMAGRLLYYKLFNLGIEAFNRLRKPLKIIGSGPEGKKLRQLAGPNIEFLPYVTDAELRSLYNNARAFIFPQIEDFGLVAAEAQACGLPVIAYNAGGAKEIVEDGKTGLLFDEQTPESLIKAVRVFEHTNFDNNYITEKAERFSKNTFQENIRRIVIENGFKI